VGIGFLGLDVDSNPEKWSTQNILQTHVEFQTYLDTTNKTLAERQIDALKRMADTNNKKKMRQVDERDCWTAWSLSTVDQKQKGQVMYEPKYGQYIRMYKEEMLTEFHHKQREQDNVELIFIREPADVTVLYNTLTKTVIDIWSLPGLEFQLLWKKYEHSARMQLWAMFKSTMFDDREVDVLQLEIERHH
jgi:hypothetical protein